MALRRTLLTLLGGAVVALSAMSPAAAAVSPRDGDIDGDGLADVVIGAPDDGTGAIHVGYGDGTWTRYTASLSGQAGYGWSVAMCDINGDSFSDVVSGAPYSTDPGGTAIGGGIVVRYGSSGGLGSPTLVTQGTSGVPGASEGGDLMGFSLGCGRINADTYADVVVGVPGEALSAVEQAGTVLLIRGAAAGLSVATTTSISQDTDGVAGTAEAFDRFGDSVAVGDVTGDAYAEIVIGAAAENLGTGLVHSLRGSAAGWTSTGSTTVYVSSRIGFGLSLAIGQFAKGGAAEVGVGSADRAGTVTMLRGGVGNLTATASVVIHQDTTGVPGTAEPLDPDNFGAALSAGDVTGDGADDLLVGNPGESIGSLDAAGSVVLLKGSTTGLTGTGSQGFDQDNASIPGGSEQGDLFGQGVTLADRTGDGKADAVIGSPGEDIGSAVEAGSMTTLTGTSTGLTTSGSSAGGASSLGGTTTSGQSLGWSAAG